ncbi:F-box/LRR-repeat protein At4g14096-like [Pistacia vera]|uniref:F-box/LRR-repeat protein At4g14096-like n=1 Tax=Pistacia vera TaxID=55513 RepID=UPI0012636240|nr:F-box/LRR-repeat protein At4g14096-like [Pistacia vera]
MSISISRIHSWTSTATSHKVLELDLALPAETLFMFPNSLLSAESLNILKLLTYSKLVVPSFIRLPNLKTLHFAVEFSEDHTGQKLFSGCPVLQELGLIDCYWKHTERDTISIPYVRQLYIYENGYPDDYPYTDRRETLHDCEVFIYAENLEYFDCSSYLTVDSIFV